jgi:hypothetical protein
MREAIELYLETLSPEERDGLLSQEILTTAVQANAKAAALDGRRSRTRAAGSRLYPGAIIRQPQSLPKGRAGGGAIPSGFVLHPKIVKQVLEVIEKGR